MLRFSLASLLVLITLVALSCAAIMNPNIYFATGLRFLLLALVPGSILVAVFCRGTQQRLAIGFALFVIGTQVSTWLFADPMGFHNRASSAVAQFHDSTSVVVPTSYPVYGWPSPGVYPQVAYYQPYISPPAMPVQPQNISNAVTLDYGAIQSIIRSLELLVMGLAGIMVAAIVDHLRRKQLAAAPVQETTHAHV